ncbi:hypothetical protein QVD17_18976 [Tagetes erecta]|uniref:Uncharacterized protein n=1 Tax=Tagetes erecta TaxID=13708 RepID=A0AAD8KJ35_TARER|nr:hypothetical protein QVD17_18976 [Tagetes erecta]
MQVLFNYPNLVVLLPVLEGGLLKSHKHASSACGVDSGVSAVLDAGAFPHLINLLSHSNEKVKSKGDHFPSSTLSIYPLQKNKMVNGEVVDDGFRIAGRTRRGFRSAQVVTLAVEKFCNVATAKLRTARLSFDKSERHPTRKLSDRKAYTRQKQATFDAADFPGSIDGQEDLMAVTKAVHTYWFHVVFSVGLTCVAYVGREKNHNKRRLGLEQWTNMMKDKL